MTVPNDVYRDWDAAYVMGVLSPSERREFEQHSAGCPDCSRQVAELAGIGGILATVPADRAIAMLDTEPAAHEPPVPRTLLPRVVASARRARLQARVRTTAMVAVAAAAVTAIVLSTGILGGNDGETLTMAQTIEVPITAETRLIEEPWGTTIEVTCRYLDDGTRPPADAPQPPFEYALYVTDDAGNTTEQATWLAGPGSVTTPTATTRLSVEEIASIDIRAVSFDDLVILEVHP